MHGEKPITPDFVLEVEAEDVILTSEEFEDLLQIRTLDFKVLLKSYQLWTKGEREKAHKDLTTLVNVYVRSWDLKASLWQLGAKTQTKVNSVAKVLNKSPIFHRMVEKARSNFSDRIGLNGDKILSMLYQEATDRTPEQPAAVRFAAQKELARIFGLGADNKDNQMISGGVMVVPAELALKDWAEKAEAQQKEIL